MEPDHHQNRLREKIMLAYFARRVLYMVFTAFLTSIIAFTVIQLPAGDFVDALAKQYAMQGRKVDQTALNNLRVQFGLDQPVYVQYFRWASQIVRGNLGWSFQSQRPVSELIGDRIVLTSTISIVTLLFVYLLAIPIGVYSATHQYTFGDYLFTLIGFIGLATPSFLLAMILMMIL
ncbi:MAG: ABC transporter permease, partial [Anaerolineaceae bacterium]|nr:ABC transporter permease [Anaerolineaceae bacterium]